MKIIFIISKNINYRHYICLYYIMSTEGEIDEIIRKFVHYPELYIVESFVCDLKEFNKCKIYVITKPELFNNDTYQIVSQIYCENYIIPELQTNKSKTIYTIEQISQKKLEKQHKKYVERIIQNDIKVIPK